MLEHLSTHSCCIILRLAVQGCNTRLELRSDPAGASQQHFTQLIQDLSSSADGFCSCRGLAQLPVPCGSTRALHATSLRPDHVAHRVIEHTPLSILNWLQILGLHMAGFSRLHHGAARFGLCLCLSACVSQPCSACCCASPGVGETGSLALGPQAAALRRAITLTEESPKCTACGSGSLLCGLITCSCILQWRTLLTGATHEAKIGRLLSCSCSALMA